MSRKGLSRLAVLVRDGVRVEKDDALAEEVPVALEYNGISHAVMLATPEDLDDFARGFTLSEAIVDDAREIYDIEVKDDARGMRCLVTISSAHFAKLKDRRRSLAGRTGCGLCGTESLEQAIRPLTRLTASFSMDPSVIARAMLDLRQRQSLMEATGAVHAAGWLDGEGELRLVREDVGRHNALDKLIGAISAEGLDFAHGAALITSRASYEMVQKAVTLRIPLLAAVSAPTALAVRMAQETHLGLLGFVRAEHYACYSAAERLVLPGTSGAASCAMMASAS